MEVPILLKIEKRLCTESAALFLGAITMDYDEYEEDAEYYYFRKVSELDYDYRLIKEELADGIILVTKLYMIVETIGEIVV